MSLQLRVSGLEELQAYLSQFGLNTKNLLIAKINECIDQGVAQMTADCPVRTGFLRDSIHTTPGQDGLKNVEASAGYAGFVNFGTYKMGPRPFFTNGYNLILSLLSTNLPTMF